MGGKLIRLTSPSTRIIGGKPAERCRSEAPCLALKANNSVISIQLKPYRCHCRRVCPVPRYSAMGGAERHLDLPLPRIAFASRAAPFTQDRRDADESHRCLILKWFVVCPFRA